jgi:myo-inositol-1(or 4)-monophosphatase
LSDALTRRFDIAIDLAEAAGDLALSMRPPCGAPETASLKGTQDWLTRADGMVERFLSERLGAAFPDDGFQGEEGGTPRGGALRWVVDPIDGTANFMRGGARFCVSLGLVDDRTPLLGVLVAPALGETYAARRGAGATLNGVPIRAATTTALERAMVEIGWSARRPNAGFLALYDKLLAAGVMPRLGGSGALGLADVAAGRIDGYLELHINLWDVAGALVILDEAGAAVSRFMDGDGPTAGNSIRAAAPGIADALARLGGI